MTRVFKSRVGSLLMDWSLGQRFGVDAEMGASWGFADRKMNLVVGSSIWDQGYQKGCKGSQKYQLLMEKTQM